MADTLLQEDLERMYAKYVAPQTDHQSTLKEIKALIRKDFGKKASQKLTVALANYGFEQGPQPYKLLEREIATAKPVKPVPASNKVVNRERIRAVSKRIPRDALKYLNKLPFKVRDVKVLTRKSVNGRKGDITFRHGDKTFRLPGGSGARRPRSGL